jgi:hypothetical protein
MTSCRRCHPLRPPSCLAPCLALLAALLCAGDSGAAPAAGGPWRLDDHLPERLSLEVQSRVRYEYLKDQFRALTEGDADVLVLRTLVHARFEATEHLTLGAEMIDSRAYLQDVPVGTGIVNAVELLQGYAQVRSDGPFGGASELRGGRITMDVGSRRLVARNRFRNTINAFTGIDWRWRGAGEREARAFWTLPVQRRPFLPRQTEDNEIQFDRETLDVQFWGVFYGDRLPGGHRGELYLFGLHESDTDRRPTRNRQLYTPGLRFWKPPSEGGLDYLVESVLQFGESRASAASARDLDHFAHFHHVEVGWSFAAPGSPRLVAQFDYASGDDDPDDGDNGRFDTLFGARRFDFGPTGIYGPFVRANLVTPGLRLQWKPAGTLSGFVSVRGFWLASDRDAWVGTGLRDRSGGSGRYLGSQIELRVRWEALPGNLRLEGGVAHLFAGRFRDDAPLSNGQGDATYAYTQATVRF